jgi:hypothetical protein
MMDVMSKPIPGSPLLDAELFRTVGRLLYGDEWEEYMAEFLGVSVRTVQRWLSKETQMPRELSEELVMLLKEKQGLLHIVLREVEEHQKQRLDFERSQG